MSDEGLISKKDVLDAAGISYGQLYRWKRKGLIPESWFVRRSTFTGQETFFPRDKILERIRQIVDLKEEHALDDLAQVIRQRVDARLQVHLSRLADLGWVDAKLLDACGAKGGGDRPISLEQAMCLGVLGKLRGKARDEELDLVRATLAKTAGGELLERCKREALILHVARKRIEAAGIAAEISAVFVGPENIILDPELTVAATVDMKAVLEKIQLELV